MVALASWFSLHAEQISSGENYEAVRARLGEPTGRIKIGETETVFFKTGEVVFLDGKTISSRILSAEEQVAIKEKRAEHLSEGQRIKAEKLADPTFRAMPYAYQVLFWEDFRMRYPGIDVAEIYAEALEKYNKELIARSAIDDEALEKSEQERAIAAQEQVTENEFWRIQSQGYLAPTYGYFPLGFWDFGAGPTYFFPFERDYRRHHHEPVVEHRHDGNHPVRPVVISPPPIFTPDFHGRPHRQAAPEAFPMTRIQPNPPNPRSASHVVGTLAAAPFASVRVPHPVSQPNLSAPRIAPAPPPSHVNPPAPIMKVATTPVATENALGPGAEAPHRR